MAARFLADALAQAKLRPWPVQEKNGTVWAWYPSEGKPPEWDFPALPEFGNPDGSEPRAFELKLEAQVPETHENDNDPVHCMHVHDMTQVPDSEITYAADGRDCQNVSHTESQTRGLTPARQEIDLRSVQALAKSALIRQNAPSPAQERT